MAVLYLRTADASDPSSAKQLNESSGTSAATYSTGEIGTWTLVQDFVTDGYGGKEFAAGTWTLSVRMRIDPTTDNTGGETSWRWKLYKRSGGSNSLLGTSSASATFTNTSYGQKSLDIVLGSPVVLDAGDDLFIEVEANDTFGDTSIQIEIENSGAQSTLTTPALVADLEQEGFWFRNDDGDEDAATFLGSQDSNVTRWKDINTRLRVLINTPDDPGSIAFRLEYRKKNTGVWKKVLTANPSGVSFVAAGAGDAGTGAIAPGMPAGVAEGDILILVIEGEGEDANADDPPTGGAWNTIGSIASATSGETDRTRISVYWAWYDPSINLAVPDAGNHTIARVYAFRGVDPDTPLDGVTPASGSNATNSASHSAATGFNTNTNGAFVVLAYSHGDDLLSSPGTFGNTSLSSVSDGGEYQNGAGSDGTVGLIYGTKATAGTGGTFTWGTSATEENAWFAFALKPAPAQPILIVTSSNITAGGEDTTPQLTPPSGKTTGNHTTGRMWDDENGADSIDIGSNGYTELEWSLKATTDAETDAVYEFRVTKAGVVLDTYSVSPEWTVSIASITKTHTTDAFLAEPGTEITHTTDAFKAFEKYSDWSETWDWTAGANAVTKTHTTDALKKKAFTVDHTTDALKKKAQEASHSIDAYIKKLDNTKAHITDADLKDDVVKAHSTDALLWQEQTKAHTTDALKRITATLDHTTDAFLLKPTTKSHTTDSYIKKLDITKSHSTDAYKKTIDVIKAHSTDAYLVKTETKDHNTDALLKKAFELAHTTDADLKDDVVKAHTTDSLLKKTLTASHSTDALLKKSFELSHSTDALLRKTQTQEHSTDALLKKAFTDEHTTDAYLRKTSTQEHTTDADLKDDVTKAHATDAYLAKSQTKEHTTDSWVKKLGQVVSHSTDALALVFEVVSHTTDTLLKKTFTKDHTADALLRKTQTSSHSTDALLRATEEKTHSTDADLKDDVVKTHTTDSLLKKTLTVLHLADALLRATQTISHFTDALKKKTLEVIHTTDALIRKAFDRSHSTDTLLRKSQEVSHTTSAYAARTQSIDHTTDAWFRKTTIVSHSTDAYLQTFKGSTKRTIMKYSDKSVMIRSGENHAHLRSRNKVVSLTTQGGKIKLWHK